MKEFTIAEHISIEYIAYTILAYYIGIYPLITLLCITNIINNGTSKNNTKILVITGLCYYYNIKMLLMTVLLGLFVYKTIMEDLSFTIIQYIMYTMELIRNVNINNKYINICEGYYNLIKNSMTISIISDIYKNIRKQTNNINKLVVSYLENRGIVSYVDNIIKKTTAMYGFSFPSRVDPYKNAMKHNDIYRMCYDTELIKELQKTVNNMGSMMNTINNDQDIQKLAKQLEEFNDDEDIIKELLEETKKNDK